MEGRFQGNSLFPERSQVGVGVPKLQSAKTFSSVQRRGSSRQDTRHVSASCAENILSNYNFAL